MYIHQGNAFACYSLTSQDEVPALSLNVFHGEGHGCWPCSTVMRTCWVASCATQTLEGLTSSFLQLLRCEQPTDDWRTWPLLSTAAAQDSTQPRRTYLHWQVHAGYKISAPWELWGSPRGVSQGLCCECIIGQPPLPPSPASSCQE